MPENNVNIVDIASTAESTTNSFISSAVDISIVKEKLKIAQATDEKIRLFECEINSAEDDLVDSFSDSVGGNHIGDEPLTPSNVSIRGTSQPNSAPNSPMPFDKNNSNGSQRNVSLVSQAAAPTRLNRQMSSVSTPFINPDKYRKRSYRTRSFVRLQKVNQSVVKEVDEHADARSENVVGQSLSPLDSVTPRPPNSNGEKPKRPSLTIKVVPEESKRILETCRFPQGAIYVSTYIGPIQVGSPCETLKDILESGLPMPKFYIVPTSKLAPNLDQHLGVSLGEFELIALYCKIILKRTTPMTLICYNEKEKEMMQSVIKNSLYPVNKEDLTKMEVDFDDIMWIEKTIPKITTEIDYLRSLESSPSCDLSFEGLFEITCLDEKGIIFLSDEHNPGQRVRISSENEYGGAYKIVEKRDYTSSEDSRRVEISSVLVLPDLLNFVPHVNPINPPLFGVTCLGNGNGFDHNSLSSGYVIWINRRGILVNPPAYSSARLEIEMGIHFSLISNVILTTSHGDFGSGTLQKLLHEGEVTVHATTTIHNSFVEKYSALSGLPSESIRKSHKFRKVEVGSSMKIMGAIFDFFYNLHSSPSIGFKVEMDGKKMVFCAGQTLDVQRIEDMYSQKILSDSRKKEFRWVVDQIATSEISFLDLFHFDPMKVDQIIKNIAENLTKESKEKLRIGHCHSSVTFPDSLKRAPGGLGPESTFKIPVANSTYFTATTLMESIEHIMFFKGLSIHHAASLVQIANPVEFKKGTKLIGENEKVHFFNLIVSGEVDVEYNLPDDKAWMELYGVEVDDVYMGGGGGEGVKE